MLKLFPATDPFASLSMDLLGALTETNSGNVFLLIIIDRFSKLVLAVPLAGITATDVSSAFCRDRISVYGPPDTVLTDNGPQFVSWFFQGVCNLMGIRNLYMSTYHPQTNGQAERFHKTLVDMFMPYIEDQKDNWDELVSVLALAYISRTHRTMGVAAMDLVTARRLSNFSLERMPHGMTPDPSQSVAGAKNAFLESLKTLLPQVRDSFDKTQARYKRDYEKKFRHRRVSVTTGDWVYLRNHTRKHKLDLKVTRPYEALKTDRRTYLIDQDGLPYRVSGDHVVPAGPVDPANPPKQPQVAVPDALQLGGSEFVLERVVDHTWDEEGVPWLLARWFGMDRTTPGNTRVACSLPRRTGTVDGRGCFPRTPTRWCRCGRTKSSSETSGVESQPDVHFDITQDDLDIWLRCSFRAPGEPGFEPRRGRDHRSVIIDKPYRQGRQRSSPRSWIHHEPGSDSHCSFRTCTTPRKRLCGAFFSCEPCFPLHTFAVEHSTPTFWMHQKRLWRRLPRCTGP